MLQFWRKICSRISGGRSSSGARACGRDCACAGAGVGRRRLGCEGSGVDAEEVEEGLGRFLPRTVTGVRPAEGMIWLCGWDIVGIADMRLACWILQTAETVDRLIVDRSSLNFAGKCVPSN